MKLIVNRENTLQTTPQTLFEIPNQTIAGGAIILAIIQAVATILGTFFGNLPKQQTDKAQLLLKEKSFQVQLLQRALEIGDSTGRANSLKLLIAAELISDPTSKISEMTKSPSTVPQWIKHPLELINGNLETSLVKPNADSGGSPAKPPFP